MNSKIPSVSTLTVAMLAAAMTTGSAAAAANLNFTAQLSGDEEVPSVDTRARGQATFNVGEDGDAVFYRLKVANIEDVLQAHIHLGPPGENGSVVAWLYPEGPPAELIEGRFSGVLAMGTITSDDLVGPLAGGTIDDLINAVIAGDTYVNVHTEAHKPGEIRGQIHGGNAKRLLQRELAGLRRATSQYQNVRKAEMDGYAQSSPFVPGMGFHYVNPELLDGEIEIDRPEALVYDSNDPRQTTRNLVAVEYIIPDPDELMDQNDLPTPFTGQTANDWHYEGDIDSWTLHVWIWLNNPEGVFHPTNPRVDLGP